MKSVNSLPLEQRRGIETTDLNDNLVLVQASVEQVVQALGQLRQVAVWERDVYEREIEIQDYSFIIFQIRKHPWTLICKLSFLTYHVTFEDKDVQSLSSLLHAKAIHYLISDTSLSLGYHLYNCGESVEKLFFTSELEGEMEDDEDEDENEEAQGTCHFQSKLRQLKAEDIENVYSFTDDFLRQQDVYVPAFFTKVYFRCGQRITLRLKGIEHDDFEQMDYVVLN